MAIIIIAILNHSMLGVDHDVVVMLFSFYVRNKLHCIALHCIALHCIALHCIALHCIALHCIALHCNLFVLFVFSLRQHKVWAGRSSLLVKSLPLGTDALNKMAALDEVVFGCCSSGNRVPKALSGFI